MARHAEWPEGKLLKFRIGPALVVLSEAELRGLLARDLDLYGQGLLRGKACKRHHALDKRLKTQGGG
jgi:hypothetical protein